MIRACARTTLAISGKFPRDQTPHRRTTAATYISFVSVFLALVQRDRCVASHMASKASPSTRCRFVISLTFADRGQANDSGSEPVRLPTPG
jgi:hypothetical protein